ncbi:hypothetical protein E3J79_01000 [Candidatus Dependentiae bacterium]|nr:MAG: hypothetical protein E3J79_01000 [Candidatus Dependentiae bacterium]
MKTIKYSALLFLAIPLCSLYGMDYRKYLDDSEYYNDFTLEAINSGNKSKEKGKKVGGYFFTEHALTRMVERKVEPEEVCWVIGHGDRYNTTSDVYFRVDTQKELGVFIKEKTVITVFIGMDQGKLNHWLEKRDKKKKAEFALKKANKKGLHTLIEDQFKRMNFNRLGYSKESVIK